MTIRELKVVRDAALSYPKGVRATAWGYGPMDINGDVSSFAYPVLLKYG